MIVGVSFFLVGFFIFILIAKQLHILENNYFKATSMGVNPALLHVTSLIAISLMAIAGFVVYAPLTLLGFAIPYITKRYLIGQYDLRLSVLPSSLMSISITLLAYIMHIYLHTDMNIMMVLIMVPAIGLMMFKKDILQCAR